MDAENTLYILEGEQVYRSGSGEPLDLSLRRNGGVILYGFRTLSLHPFTFPFRHVSRIREALTLQLQPLSGGAQRMEIFPLITERQGQGVSGVAFVVAREELNRLDRILEHWTGALVWPLPLPLGAELDRGGLAVAAGEAYITSMLFEEGIPRLYRWRPRAGETLQQEEETLVALARANGIEVETTATCDLAGEDDGCVDRLAAGCRALEEDERLPIGEMNISSAGLHAVLATEHLLAFSRKAALVLAAVALVFAGTAFYSWSTTDRLVETIRQNAEALYRETFPGSGTVRDPLSQARARLQGDESQSRGVAAQRVLAALGNAWGSLPENHDLQMEFLQYSPEGAELRGTAREMNNIRYLRDNLQENFPETQLGDIQQVPGGELRFTLSIRWSQS
ncbi:MAG: hypothetical protein K9L28_07185 [Synergistales bacterium]|nr:hypothetical protein [Synergistales bacterium]